MRMQAYAERGCVSDRISAVARDTCYFAPFGEFFNCLVRRNEDTQGQADGRGECPDF